MWNRVLGVAIVAFGLFLTFRFPKQHCVCGVKIPEGGGLCECGEYNGRAFVIKDKRREQELRRVEEERRKGNDYDTFL